MKKLIAILIFVLSSTHTNAQLQHLWSHDIGTPNATTTLYQQYSVDKSGNTVVGFNMYSATPYDVDPDSGHIFVQPINNHLTFIAKYDKDGKTLFAKDFKNSAYDDFRILNIENDAYNNIYLFGDFNGTIDMDPDTSEFLLTNNVAHTVYICKLDSNGEFITAIKITNTTDYCMHNVYFDNYDNLLICGYKIGPGGFNTGSCSFTSNNPAYFAKFDLNLNCQFICPIYQITPSQDPTYVLSICTDSLKNIYISGNSGVSIDADPSPASYQLTAGFFLAKYDSLGHLLIAKSTKDGWGDAINEMKMDKNNQLCVVGQFMDSLDFDFNPSTNNNVSSMGASSLDAFYGRYDDQLNLINIQVIANPGHGAVYSFALDDSSNMYVVGYFADTIPPIANINFAGMKSRGTGDGLLFKAAPNGQVIFAQQWGGEEQNDIALKTYLRNDNSLYLGGTFIGNCDFDFSNSISYLSTPMYISEAFFAKFSINDLTNKISGDVFIDYNDNGIKDNSDIALQNVILKIEPGPFFVSSQPDGSYFCFVDTGTYTISIPNPPIYYQNINPAQHVITFIGNSQTSTANNFGFNPAENLNDLHVTVTNLQPTRPGFPVDIIIDYKNKGTVPLPAIIQLNYDSGLSFVSAFPSIDSSSQQLLFWNLDTLMPLQQGQLTLHFNVIASLGDSLYSSVIIRPYLNDVTPLNNLDTLKNLVTGSYDPNDKSVDKEVVSVEQLKDTILLTYLIRFQNTGNDTAFTVNIIDSIKNKLVLTTFEMLSSSHSCKMNLENNCMLFTFKNILMPDSNTNEQASHGFIKYRIKARKNLVSGDKITNKAFIYFDYNEPVKTNTAVTAIVSPTGYSNYQKDNSVQLIPNPFSKNAQLIFANDLHQSFDLKILDVTGRTVFKTATTSSRIAVERRNMDSGIYIYQLVNSDSKETFNGKMIVE